MRGGETEGTYRHHGMNSVTNEDDLRVRGWSGMRDLTACRGLAFPPSLIHSGAGALAVKGELVRCRGCHMKRRDRLVENRPIERRVEMRNGCNQSRIPVRNVLEYLLDSLAIAPVGAKGSSSQCITSSDSLWNPNQRKQRAPGRNERTKANLAPLSRV